MDTYQILIVEDEPSVARGLKHTLQKEGYSVDWAETGKAALALARETDPDLILLDIRLPDMSGFDVCRQLRAAGNYRPILMVTARDEEVDRVLGLELGADDYIVKPFGLRELLSRVRANLRRASGEYSRPASETRLRFGTVELDPGRMQVTRCGQPVFLTPTEFRLLHHLASNPNRAFSRDALVEAVWGYDSQVLNDRTVDVHIHNLREKLEEDPENPLWLVTVRGLGYRFET